MSVHAPGGPGNVTTATAISATIAAAKPANTTDGDLLVAVVNSQNAGGGFDIVPAGWAQAALFNAVRTTGVFVKPIPSAAGETAVDYSWHTTAGSGRIGASVFRVTGADLSAPVDAVGAGVGTGTAQIAAAAVQAATVGALLLAVFTSYIATGTPNQVTAPAGMTPVAGWSVTSGTASSTHLCAVELLATAGDTGTRTATAAPAGTGAAAIMLTIKAAVGEPPDGQVVAHTGPGDLTQATVTGSAVMRIACPPNTANADLLVAVLYHRNSGPAFTTLPPGWAAWPVGFTANGVLVAYWRHVTDAAGEPEMYTWRSPNGSARGAGMIFRVTGAAPPSAASGPVAAVGAPVAVGAGATGIAAPGADVAAPGGLAIGCYATVASDTTVPQITAPPGMSPAAGVPVVTATAAAYLAVATEPLTGPGPTGPRTAAVAPAAGGGAGFLLVVAPAGHGTPQPPELLGQITGGVTHQAAQAAALTRFAATARFAVSTSPELASPAYTAADAPDRDGIARGALPGLAPDTVYYWGVELDGALAPGVARFRTSPAPGTAVSFSFAAGSCADTNSSSPAFDGIRARTGPGGQPARFMAHLGDMHYQDIGINDPAWVAGAWFNALTRPAQHALWQALPLAYTWSDHDYSHPNTDAAGPAGPASQAVYRRLFPAHPLPGDGAGIYQAWTIGRVRFIMTDGRSYASPIAQPDDAAKTKLGPSQKAWLKEQLLRPEPVKVWFHEDAWAGRSTFPGDDTWTAYGTERAELAEFVRDNGVALLYVHGDYHVLGADDGSHVPGGFPVISCSPLDQTPFNGNGLWSNGFYPNPATGTAKRQQYGWFDVVDEGGDQVVIRFSGISDGVVVIEQVMSFGRRPHIGWGQSV